MVVGSVLRRTSDLGAVLLKTGRKLEWGPERLDARAHQELGRGCKVDG